MSILIGWVETNDLAHSFIKLLWTKVLNEISFTFLIFPNIPIHKAFYSHMNFLLARALCSI